jgi:2,5-diketo-D-gluconate reductase A
MVSPAQVPSVVLANGVKVPQVGLGVFKVPDDQTQRTVEQAFEAGYRHVDTAAGYYNEAGVGAALRASGLRRHEVFVTTKLRNGDQGYDSALQAFEDSREALDVEVVDLYLIHWPVPSRDLYVETWRAFEKLYADGAVRAIGVSNFLPEHLARLLAETDVVPAVNQIEVHPTYQQRATQEATRAAGIAVEAYSPLGRGADLSHPVVIEIARAHGITPAQAILRWHLQQDRVVIPKSVDPQRIAANIDLFGVELDAAEIAAIDALDSDARLGSDPATAAFSQYPD